jgi:hypothetical protein
MKYIGLSLFIFFIISCGHHLGSNGSKNQDFLFYKNMDTFFTNTLVKDTLEATYFVSKFDSVNSTNMFVFYKNNASLIDTLFANYIIKREIDVRLQQLNTTNYNCPKGFMFKQEWLGLNYPDKIDTLNKSEPLQIEVFSKIYLNEKFEDFLQTKPKVKANTDQQKIKFSLIRKSDFIYFLPNNIVRFQNINYQLTQNEFDFFSLHTVKTKTNMFDYYSKMNTIN